MHQRCQKTHSEFDINWNSLDLEHLLDPPEEYDVTTLQFCLNTLVSRGFHEGQLGLKGLELLTCWYIQNPLLQS